MPNPEDFDFPLSRTCREWTDPSLPHLVSPEEEQAERDMEIIERNFLAMREMVNRSAPAPRRAYDRGKVQIQTVFVPMPSLPPKVEGKKPPTLKTPKG